jgi:hypothetical protein
MRTVDAASLALAECGCIGPPEVSPKSKLPWALPTCTTCRGIAVHDIPSGLG